ncbi:MAG: hypothetical protein ACREBB_09225 [Nitrosotalea sp.]
MSSKFLKNTIIIVIAGAIAISVLYGVGFVDKCPIRQLDIAGELKKYDQTKDPELCAQLNDKISQFDNECKGDVEILDCG